MPISWATRCCCCCSPRPFCPSDAGTNRWRYVVRSRPDEFPRSSLVLVPPASVSRLGETVELLGDGRARPTGAKCFHVAPTRGAGLRELKIDYQANAGVMADSSHAFLLTWPQP